MIAPPTAVSDMLSASRKPLLFTVFAALLAASVWSCGDSSTSPGSLDAVEGVVLPFFADDDNNGINDYVEAGSHDSGTSPANLSASRSKGAGRSHSFVDGNSDGVCDHAQDGSNTWHGPGFVDADGNGICDYWQEGHSHFNRHLGLRFRDRNRNRVGDYFEAQWHEGWTHGWIDRDGDGICDRAQDGSNSWHGPGFTDTDGDGICDYWQPGGPGFRYRNRNGKGNGE